MRRAVRAGRPPRNAGQAVAWTKKAAPSRDAAMQRLKGRSRFARQPSGRGARWRRRSAVPRGATLVATRPQAGSAAAFAGRGQARRPSARPTCAAVFTTSPLSAAARERRRCGPRPVWAGHSGACSRALVPSGLHRPRVAVGDPRATVPHHRGPGGSVARGVAICQYRARFRTSQPPRRCGGEGEGEGAARARCP